MTRAAEAGSFSRAARLLQLDPSAISHAVTELEKDLGLRLFHRTTRQLSLTEEGHEVLRRARTMLLDMTEIQNLSSRTRQRLEGTLRIGMSIAVSQHVVMPRMAEFLQRHPDVRVESLILNEPKDMHAASLDVMFHSGNPRDSELVAKRIGTLRLAVYAAPSYLARAGQPKQPHELASHACLIHKPPFIPRGWNDWQFSKGDQCVKVKVPQSLMTDDREGLLAAALAGGGILRIGLLQPGIVTRGQLVRILTDWTCPGGPDVHLLYRRTSQANPKVRAFFEFVEEVFSQFDPLGQSFSIARAKASIATRPAR